MAVRLRRKEGNGVGAHLPFEDRNGNYIGNLTFHEGLDWQITDSSQCNKYGWEVFDQALKMARKQYPNG